MAAAPCTRSCLPSLVSLLVFLGSSSWSSLGLPLGHPRGRRRADGAVLVGGGGHGTEESALEAYALGESGLEGGAAPPSHRGTRP
ncbi:hypothetical protein DDQ41_27055 [Streptomyces spongiicola]|uniref:Uncharacterized protein n=1 Tax=Streptomyces spongiicola TaxID=1690221 RepID=A0ABM6VD40_9ACTN|nr:hypothetical protein DDQ41_27055 [Streptomyces spongiicola]